MARTYTLNSGAVALSASATKSLLLINPTVSYVVTELGVSFDAAATTSAVLVDLYRTTTIGSPAGTSTTPVRENASADSAASATGLVSLTTEPTAVELIRSFYVQPFGGLVVLQFPLGREPQMSGTSANRIGVRVTTPASTTPNARAWLAFEE